MLTSGVCSNSMFPHFGLKRFLCFLGALFCCGYSSRLLALQANETRKTEFAAGYLELFVVSMVMFGLFLAFMLWSQVVLFVQVFFKYRVVPHLVMFSRWLPLRG